jgi:hypothetical protein
MAGDSGDLRFPVAHEFSPGQVKLRRVLELIAANEGNRDAIVEAVRTEYYVGAAKSRDDPAERLGQQRERSSNVLRGLGSNGYQLFDLETNMLTDMGRELLALSDDELMRSFARHILRDRQGLTLLDAVRALQDRHEPVTKARLAAELRSQGFALPTATTHHTTMLNWLKTAGIVDKDAVVDEQRVADILGFDASIITEWRGLTREQHAFLRTLRSMSEASEDAFIPVSEVYDRAVVEHGPIFKDDQLRARVTKPLAESNWLELKVKQSGRGAKSGEVRASTKLLTADLALLGEERAWGVPPDLRLKLNTPIKEIQNDLNSSDTYTKGIALELLAVRLASDLTLTPRAFRLRGTQTGGAEVDLVAEGAHLHFSRWLFQCKNVAKDVPLSDLAKEVGMAVILRAHVIVLVTTSDFSQTVHTYAKELMDSNYLQVVLVNGHVLGAFAKGGPNALREHFHQEAGRVMSLKRVQLSRAESDI